MHIVDQPIDEIWESVFVEFRRKVSFHVLVSLIEIAHRFTLGNRIEWPAVEQCIHAREALFNREIERLVP